MGRRRVGSVKSLLLLPFLVLSCAADPPGRSAARPTYFRLSTPFRVAPRSSLHAGLLADSSGFVVAGYSESTAAYRRSVGVAAADNSGKLLWSRRYGTRRKMIDPQAIRTRDGGLLVWGYQADPAVPHLLRIGAKGESLWCRTYSGPLRPGEYGHPPNAIAQTSDGGFVLAGILYDPSGKPAYLLRINAPGDTLWFRSYSGKYLQGPHYVQQTADGGYIMTGGAGGDVCVARTDSDGDMLWSHSYGNPGIDCDEGQSVQQTKDNGFVIAGLSSRRRPASDHGFGPECDAYLIRTDRNGDSLWTRTYGDKETQAGNWVRQTVDGGFTWWDTQSDPQ